MSDSIHEVKRRLSPKYLGKAGIHAIGVRPEGAIAVYYSGAASGEREAIFQNLHADAHPFPVRLIEEEAPRAAEPAR